MLPILRRLYPDAPDTAIAGLLVRDTGWLEPAGWNAADHAYMQAELRAVTLAWKRRGRGFGDTRKSWAFP